MPPGFVHWVVPEGRWNVDDEGTLTSSWPTRPPAPTASPACPRGLPTSGLSQRPHVSRADVLVGVAAVLERFVAHSDTLLPSRLLPTAFDGPSLGHLSIRAYVRHIVQSGLCSNECFVLALVYGERLLQRYPEFSISRANVHRLLLVTTLVASKILDDFYCRNTYYALAGNISKQELVSLELKLCFLLAFDLTVSPDEFVAYARTLKHTEPTVGPQAAAFFTAPVVAMTPVPASLSLMGAQQPASLHVGSIYNSGNTLLAQPLEHAPCMQSKDFVSSQQGTWTNDSVWNPAPPTQHVMKCPPLQPHLSQPALGHLHQDPAAARPHYQLFHPTQALLHQPPPPVFYPPIMFQQHQDFQHVQPQPHHHHLEHRLAAIGTQPYGEYLPKFMVHRPRVMAFPTAADPLGAADAWFDAPMGLAATPCLMTYATPSTLAQQQAAGLPWFLSQPQLV